MAWTTMKTWTAAVLSSSDMNTYLRDNGNELRQGGIAMTSQANGRLVIASSATQHTTSRSFVKVFAEVFG